MSTTRLISLGIKSSGSSENYEEEKPEKNINPDDNITMGISATYYEYKDFDRIFKVTNQKLGDGKFGRVKKATWNGTDVAIKEITYNNNYCKREVCQREKSMMQLLMSMNAPNIVKLIAYTETQQKYYLVMEYMPKGSLFGFMDANPGMPWTSRYRIMREITHALAFLHTHNIVHRDIKGDNILLDQDEHAKLADFGFAKVIDNEIISCGTPGWIAPEIIRGESPANGKSDVYSLAALFWEIAMGDGFSPFENHNPDEVCLKTALGRTEPIPKDCPLKVAMIITWGLRTDPKKRPDIHEIEEELRTDINTISKKLAEVEKPKFKSRNYW